MKSMLRLFKGVVLHDAGKGTIKKEDIESFLRQTVEYGFILAPEITANYTASEVKKVIEETKEVLGLSASQANSSFHKSWQKVATASKCQLLYEQIVHYITTYGFERLGIYSKDSVYIPRESLSIPGLEKDFPLLVIKGYTRDEMLAKLMTILGSGIALKPDTLADVVEVSIFFDLDAKTIEKVKNKEAKIMLYESLGKVPKNPVEFLRLVIYATTSTTLIIKNETLINAIKIGNTLRAAKLFKQYEKDVGYKSLASIFNRYKPIFLAFRVNDLLKHEINVISKLSKEYHEPMMEDFLNRVTSMIGKKIDLDTLRVKLGKANFFRKARLAYALKFRTEDPVSIMYKIRNGSAYATSFEAPNAEETNRVLDVVLRSIMDDLSGFNGKKIYIPENVVYALPSTEKQFSGDIPAGSFVEIGKDLILGIYWENLKVDGTSERVDLDLSMSSISEKYGWDGYYRSEGGDILFSGDMTDAECGASEMFYLKKQSTGNFILSVNHFNHRADKPVPFTIFIGKERRADLPPNFMLDPNNVICKAKSSMDKRQKVLGLVTVNNGVAKFHFSEAQIGNARSMRMKEYDQHALRYLMSFYTNPISLNALLARAGAIIVTDKDKKGECDLDWSPESITRDTFLTLARKNKNEAEKDAD